MTDDPEFSEHQVDLSAPLRDRILSAVQTTEPEEGGFRVLVEPSKKSEGPPLPDSSLWETPLADPELESGRVVWTGTCIQCHSTGLGGAPLIGR